MEKQKKENTGGHQFSNSGRRVNYVIHRLSLIGNAWDQKCFGV